MFSVLIISLLIFLLAIVLYRSSITALRAKSLPPGPPPLPLLGNLLQIPTKKSYLKFHEWTLLYGPIISLKLGSENLIILNKATAVRDLFDKRGAIYSSRPPNYIGAEVITRDNVHLLLTPYGPEFRLKRKIFKGILGSNVVSSLLPVQEVEATLTLQQLAHTPAEYYDHIRRYSSAVVLQSVYGMHGKHFTDPNISRLYHVQNQFTSILETGAAPPVDIFPFLKYLPTFMSSWRKWALAIRKEQRSLYFDLLNKVKERKSRGIHRNCFIDRLLDEPETSTTKLNDEHIAYMGGTFMEGGSDTIASTLLSFLMAMVKYPEALQKAQEEVDAICGAARSPTFADIESMPYIKACATETLRWRPVAAGGIPHALIQDDVYKGFQFPKGSIFLANTWAIHNDLEYYDHPELFSPDRYTKNEFGFKDGINIPEGIRTTYSWGAGRRACGGQLLAESSLYINMAKLVWAFNFNPGSDAKSGKKLSLTEIDDSIETAWTDGFLSAPKPFPLEISLRSPTHGVVIDKECSAAAGMLHRD